MEEDIEHVQKALEVAFVEFGHLVEAQPANATNSTKQVHANATNSSVVPQKPANSTAVHSTEKVSASSSNVSQVLSKREQIKQEHSQRIHLLLWQLLVLTVPRPIQ